MSSCIVSFDGGMSSRMVIVPSPALAFPLQYMLAPAAPGVPLNTFFMRGSSLLYGDHALHWCKSAIFGKITSAGAAITTARSMAKASGWRDAMSSSAPSTTRRMMLTVLSMCVRAG